MSLGERIKGKREQMGWTQAQLAEKAGVSRQSIGSWEANRAMPDSDKLVILAGLFGCSVDSLLHDGPEIPGRKEVNGFVQVPVLRSSELRGAQSLEAVVIEAETRLSPLTDRTGAIVEGKPPFVVAVDSAGMGVEVGAELYVNPGEEIRTGDAVLCCVGGTWMIRGIVWRRDGSAELRLRDQGSIVAARDEINDGWVILAGKIMQIVLPPPNLI